MRLPSAGWARIIMEPASPERRTAVPRCCDEDDDTGREQTVQKTAATGDEPRPGDGGAPEDPWLTVRRQQDRRRYLRVLAVRRGPNAKLRRPDPAVGLPRAANPLLGPPASVTRTPTNTPVQQDVRNYLRHSADLTMRGGNAAGLVYPLAACALAEHYVFRRVGGSGSGAVAAAATAAAELGRGAPDRAESTSRDPEQDGGAPGVAPGFGGLAELVG